MGQHNPFGAKDPWAVVVVTSANDGERAVQYVQLGAVDVLVKPVENARLAKAIERALRGRDARIGQAQAQRLLKLRLGERPTRFQHAARGPAESGCSTARLLPAAPMRPHRPADRASAAGWRAWPGWRSRRRCA